MKGEYYRQGDISFHPSTEQRAGAMKREVRGEYTVALGEQTGHHHTLYPQSADAVIVEELLGDERWLELQGEWLFKHQTHGPHVICPGRYRIHIERERDPFRDAIVRVRD